MRMALIAVFMLICGQAQAACEYVRGGVSIMFPDAYNIVVTGSEPGQRSECVIGIGSDKSDVPGEMVARCDGGTWGTVFFPRTDGTLRFAGVIWDRKCFTPA